MTLDIPILILLQVILGSSNDKCSSRTVYSLLYSNLIVLITVQQNYIIKQSPTYTDI
jgi:hypothetical protein